MYPGGGIKNTAVYFGDQGLMSAAFVDDVKFYDYPRIRDLWYMPYNFCLWYYDRKNEKPKYQPAIIHFAGAFKPWDVEYHIEIKRFSHASSHSMSELKIGQAEWYYLWHEYAICTDKILQEIGY